MSVKRKHIIAPTKYVKEILQCEAPDIPTELIEGEWFQTEIDLAEINVDINMIKRHDEIDSHIQRKKFFIDLINNKKEIPPLIILNSVRGKNYLVDGYARYRALSDLEILSVSILKRINN